MKEIIQLLEHSNKLQYDDAKHTYVLDGNKLTSVSRFVSNFYPKFDSEYHANRIAKRDGKTIEQVLGEWKEKADQSTLHRGTPYHNYIENRIKGIVVRPPDRTIVKQTDAILQWMKDNNIFPLLCEFKTYDIDLGIAGTMDLLAYNTVSNKFLILDWKTNKEIVTSNPYKKFMKLPFNKYADNNYNHYCLQINLYRYCLEKVLGNEFEEGWIVHLDHDSSIGYYKTIDLRKEISKISNFL